MWIYHPLALLLIGAKVWRKWLAVLRSYDIQAERYQQTKWSKQKVLVTGIERKTERCWVVAWKSVEAERRKSDED